MVTSASLHDIRIETSRLIIREYCPEDLPSIHEYASQALVVRYENWGPNSYADTEQFLQQTQQDKERSPRLAYELCVDRKEDGRQIGGCRLGLNEEDSDVPTMGYIMNPLFWNQGYATEVSRALVNFGFTQLNLATIRATCDSRNSASKRVLEKTGFVLERAIMNDFIQKGEMRSTYVFMYTHYNEAESD